MERASRGTMGWMEQIKGQMEHEKTAIESILCCATIVQIVHQKQCRMIGSMLEIRRLEKIIENRSVLYIEQLDIAAGEVIAVVGPTNSGKTLLIQLLAGMLVPGGGTVTLDG